MSRLNGVPNNLSPDEVFEEAVARLEAGETLEGILASYPLADQAELRDFLTIVQATQQLRSGPVPQPSVTRRRQAKQNFLAAAAEMRSQSNQAPAAQTPSAVRSSEPVRATAATTPAPATTPSNSAANRATARIAAQRKVKRGESWYGTLIATFQNMFTVRTLRLAPLILVLAVVLLSTTTLVTVAQAAVPGDLAYTLKQWIRKQELELAPLEQRDLVRQMHEMELVEDVKRAALRADTNATVIQAEDTQIFYGRNGRVLRIGGLTVLDRYQPDANQENFQAMLIDGDLVPGSLVRLVYQIMPGQSDTVQGVSLSVVEPPSEEITPALVEDDTDTPTAAPAEATCAAELPDGWVTYQVRAGDNLTFIANRGNTTIEELLAANCLEDDRILIGATLFVPAESLQTGSAVRTCDAEIPAGWAEYEVSVGDNLSVIAQRAGTTVNQLKEVNCLTSDTILIGATLVIPEVVPENSPSSP